MEPLYLIKLQCANCETSFQTSRVRPSFKKATKTDTDFCCHYKEVNPDYYVVRICPYCGFATTESFSDTITDGQRKAFFEKIGRTWSFRDYGGERNWETALETYKLALMCAQIKNEKERVIAGLLHHLAWLYRYVDNREQEQRFMRFALDAYIRVFEVEGVNLNNARLMYLIGELNRRLGHYHDAVKWFSRVINDKQIMDAGMIRASREQWMQLREDMLAERLELPEEMKEDEGKKYKI